MAQKDALIAELKMEAGNTKKMLERVPLSEPGWRPHEKSMPVANLAAHVADLPTWISMAIKTDELDFAKSKYQPDLPKSNEDLVSSFESNVKGAMEALESADDELMQKPWTLRNGDHIIFTMPKGNVIRSFALNHLYHHRAQLGVYLRLNNVPVPGFYGPTADDAN